MIHVTTHAIERYIERVRNCTAAEAILALSSRIIIQAADFGAHYVRLGTGQRIVLEGRRVITVLPREQRASRLRDFRHAG